MRISKDVWVRIIVFVLAWINVLLGKFAGFQLPYIGEELIATAIAAIVSVYSAFKDNDITDDAIRRKRGYK